MVTHGYSDDGTLCGLGFPFQTTQGAGGASGSDPWLQGAVPDGHMEKILRTFSEGTFSWPVLNDDVIEPPF